MRQEEFMPRLAFIRYLYDLGIQQSRQPEPANAVSVLMFHDCAELFLALSAEHLNVGKRDTGFMEYWPELAKKLASEPAEKETMRRLNDLRVNLKHKGLRPHKIDVEGARANITNFFEANTSLIFGIDFNAISMTELVQNAEAHTALEEASKFMGLKQMKEAIEQIAFAFDRLLASYDPAKRGLLSNSPAYNFGPRLSSLPLRMMGQDRGLYEILKGFQTSIEAMREALKVLACGLDYQRYAKFRQLAPEVIWTGDGGHMFIHKRDAAMLSTDDCTFCYNFVIESALRLQEIDL